MMLMRTSLWLMAMLALCGRAQALEVEEQATGLVVKGRGEVSVFSPRPDEVWVVAPDDDRGPVTARTGWEVGWLQAPVPALRLKTPAAREWHVVNLPHAQFEVRMGKAVAATLVLPKQSMIVLKDGTVLGNAEMVPVASDDGLRFKVGTGGRWGVGVEDKAVVQGGVVAVALTSEQLAGIEPAAGSVLPTPANPDKAGTEKFDDTVTLTDVPKDYRETPPEVPMFGAEELSGVDTPVAAKAARVEDLPQLAVLSARRLYLPGTLVPFTLPEGYRLVDSQIVRVPTGKRMEALVNTDMALAEAESRVKSLLEDPLEAVVGHEPVQEQHEAPAEEHAAEPVAEHVEEPQAHAEEPEAHGEAAPAEEHGETAAEHGEEAAEGHATEETHGEVVEHGEVVSDTLAMEEEEEPVTDGWLPGTGRVKNYLPAVMKIQHEIARASTPQAGMAARRALAQHYLAWKRPQEALAVSGLISPTLPVDDLLTGVSLIATRDYADASKRLEGIGGAWRDHGKMWLAVAKQGDGASAAALEAWPETADVLVKQYPLWLRDLAMQNRAEALLAVAPGREARDYIEKAIEARGRVTPAWERLRGLGLLAVKDRAGLEPLAAAAEQTQDRITSYRAKYDFVQALRGRNELEDRQMIAYLEGLRYEWRGDEMEENVLRQLGSLYVARQDYRTGLERWRTLVQAYPDYPAMGQLTTEMVKAVEQVFNPDGNVTYGPLEYLGLYYDFRELLPTDSRGDAITEQVADVLMEEGLYERAMPLYDQLLSFRTPTVALDRARLAISFADAQRLSGVPQDALRTLDKHENDVTNSVLKERWNIAVAQALLALDRPADAVKTLVGMKGPLARELRLEGQWRNQNWPQVVVVSQDILGSVSDSRVVATNTDLQVALLRQAFAYSQMQEGEKIQQVQNRFAEGLDKVPTVRDTMTALAGLNGVEGTMEVSDRPLGRFAGALNGINQIAATMEATRAAHEAEKAEQREYNQKMDYMQLLPPPAL